MGDSDLGWVNTGRVCRSILTTIIVGVTACAAMKGPAMEPMVLVEGGTFGMGDVFDEGEANEQPVHEVTLAAFYLARNQVTVAEFRRFVNATGYRTSAEGTPDPEQHASIVARFRSGELTREEMQKAYAQLLTLAGAARWSTETPSWGFDHDINWSKPGYPQTDSCPVVCISWIDAARYCNWLSESEGVSPAYDMDSERLLDSSGHPTSDVMTVSGYRLPTEAEWEFAAREGGRKVRFGNGQNVARPSEMNFRADTAEHDYCESGEYRRRTTPVGSFPPNALGIHDMSGNAWEWMSDSFADYGEEPQTNPHPDEGTERILRGGRWGGTADQCRVFHRSSWAPNDRCNNSGFRLARSSGR